MPKLDWIGKDKVISHHLDVPVRVLNHKYGFRANSTDTSETNSGNMIIHGDNLEALKALLPKYEGQVSCIYIDPPYNTGNENWVYNDNVNDPKIKKWLGDVVGPEGEDLCRHDKWLCMMYPRLQLLSKLLSEQGIIFISIDSNELFNLKSICDEIFGSINYVELFSWHKTYSPSNLSHTTKKCIEYILCYAKNIQSVNRFKGLLKVNEADNPLLKKGNADKILRFPKDKILGTFRGEHNFLPGDYGTSVNKIRLIEPVHYKDGIFNDDVVLEGPFIWTQSTLLAKIAEGTSITFKTPTFAPRYDKKEYLPEVPRNLIDKDDCVGTTEEGGIVLKSIFGKAVFDYPKPPSLIQYLVNFVTLPGSVVLDAFAGSGTTGHAILNLNKEDNGDRKFILCEMCEYAEPVTAERIRRVINGYGEGANITAGTGGSFDFYELGETFFTEDGLLNENIPEEKIREYIYYTETRQPLVRPREGNSFLLDTFNNTGFYFYFKPNEVTTFGPDTLKIVTEKADSYVVYADKCTLSEDYMLKHNIVFKKIPRDIKQF